MKKINLILILSFSLFFIPLSVHASVLSKDLQKGVDDDEVAILQKFLNLDPDTVVANSGDGSLGSETSYFGNLTKNAVIRFQNKYASDVLTPLGLSSGTGFVGEKTRQKIEELYYPAFQSHIEKSLDVFEKEQTRLVGSPITSISLDKSEAKIGEIVSFNIVNENFDQMSQLNALLISKGNLSSFYYIPIQFNNSRMTFIVGADVVPGNYKVSIVNQNEDGEDLLSLDSTNSTVASSSTDELDLLIKP
ncbi:MAG: hypothetical protein WCW87_03505 [Candidatus Paceibacterota bacterium]